MESRIEIPKRKRPAALIVFFFLLLGATGIWVLIRFVYPTLPGFLDLKLSAIGAIAGAVLFGIYAVIKQSNKKVPALVIDEMGITDHSNVASVGFIPWGDIISIKEVRGDLNRTLIAVVVKNPETYINRSSGMADSRQVQYQQFGTPILINLASLDYPAQHLVNLLKDQMEAKEI